MPQMVRMAKDAYTIIKAADPSAMVTTPSSVNAGSGHSIDIWLPAFLAAGGGNYADIVAFHGYINPALGQEPEAITKTVDQVTSSLTGALTTKPIWNTEGGWTCRTRTCRTLIWKRLSSVRPTFFSGSRACSAFTGSSTATPDWNLLDS